MQSGYTAHITPSEWRWVIFASVGLVLLAFTPFLLMFLGNIPGPNWQFMGILHNHRDGATYLSKMMLGSEGEWLVHFQHTPEDHSGAFIQVIYPILGHVANLTSLPLIVLFHVARVASSLFMYMAIYQLAASIWMRLRTRRIFFIVLAVGAGLGWLYAPLTGGSVDTPDLSIPEAFPFYSSLVNVHFPLTLACMALVASIVIMAFRPGVDDEPGVNNGGLTAVLLSLALAFLYPQALVPMGVGLALYIGIRWIRAGYPSMRELRWLLVIVLPAVPMAAYYLAVVMYNPAMAEWNSQNVTSAPSPLALVLGLALPLLMALPGIYRTLRRFEADGDQFMLIWLLVMLVAIYLPTNIQRRFAVGIMIPIVYFATRSLEDFWFQHINRRWRYRLFGIVIPVMMLTQVFVLLTPLLPLVVNKPENSQGLFLQRDYVAAFEWLQDRARLDDVVLASEHVSLWLPAWAGMRVVYGHPYETLDAEVKQQQVLDWYDSGTSGDCDSLLERYNIRFVIVGPQERALGETNCQDHLTAVFTYGSVTIYAT